MSGATKRTLGAAMREIGAGVPVGPQRG